MLKIKHAEELAAGHCRQPLEIQSIFLLLYQEDRLLPLSVKRIKGVRSILN